MQEIFVKIARDEKILTGVREERAFLIRLAHNAAVDLMRRRGTRERVKENLAEIISPFASTSDPDEQVFRDELAADAIRIGTSGSPTDTNANVPQFNTVQNTVVEGSSISVSKPAIATIGLFKVIAPVEP